MPRFYILVACSMDGIRGSGTSVARPLRPRWAQGAQSYRLQGSVRVPRSNTVHGLPSADALHLPVAAAQTL